MADEISKDDLPQEVVDYIEALEDLVDELTPDADDKSDDEIVDEVAELALAKADPAIRELVAKAEERVAEAEAIAKAERAERLRRDRIEKAGQLPMISTNRDRLGELIGKVEENLDLEDAAEVWDLLSKANAALAESNLFNEIGSHSTVAPSLEAAAESIRKEDPTLTKEQAVAVALDRNPHLYEEA